MNPWDSDFYGTSRLSLFVRNLLVQNTYTIIEPYSIGDAVYSLGLLPAFRRRYCRKGEKILFVANKRCSGLAPVMPFADLYHFADLLHLEFHLETIARCSLSPSVGWPIVAAPDMYGNGILHRLGLGTTIERKKAVFYLPPTDPFHFPEVKAEHQMSAVKKLKAAKATEGNSILLITSAQTFQSFSEAHWEALALELSGHRKVLTEMHGRSQPIKGTEPISLDLPELIPAIDSCGNAIFLRSGLCDLCVNAKGRMLNIIPPSSFRNIPGDDTSEQVGLTMKNTLGGHYPDSNFRDVIFQTPPDIGSFLSKVKPHFVGGE